MKNLYTKNEFLNNRENELIKEGVFQFISNMFNKAKAYINNKVFYYGDNDTAGEELYNTLITDGFSVKDMRYEYNIYNDFNDKLKAER